MLAFRWTPFWGTLPDYLAAAGTVGAFFAGVRLLRKELEARRDDIEDRRSAQARLVAAWVSPSHPEVDPDGSNPRRVYYILTRNGSSEPVQSVQVVTRARPSGITFIKSDQPPPARKRSGKALGQLRGYKVIAPDTTEVDQRTEEEYPRPDEWRSSSPTPPGSAGDAIPTGGFNCSGRRSLRGRGNGQ
jgi:hypothetical protein